MCLALAQTHRSLMVFTNAVVWPQPTLPPLFGCRVWVRYALCMDHMFFYMNCVCSGFILLVMSLQLSWGICVTVLDVAFFVPLVLYSPAVSYSNCEEIAKKGLDCSEVGGIVGMECVHFWLVWLAECVSWTMGSLLQDLVSLVQKPCLGSIPDLDVHYFWSKHLGCCCPPGDNRVYVKQDTIMILVLP